MLSLLRSELFRLRKRPQAAILVLVTVLLTGGIYAAFFIASRVIDDRSEQAAIVQDLAFPGVFRIGMEIGSLFVSIMLIVMASGLIANEYGWDTIRPLVTRARSRSSLLTAKWITVVLYTLLLFLVTFLSSVLFSAVTSSLAGEFVGPSTELLREWGAGFGRAVVAILPFVVIAFSIALLTRSNAAGISVGIAVGVLEPALWALLGLLSDRFDTLRTFGIDYHSTRLLGMNSGPERVSAGDAWISVGVLAAYMAAFVAVSYIVFNRRDVVSG